MDARLVKGERITYWLVFILLIFSNSVAGQYFGRNKVNYHQFDFKILRTPHFDIYNYMGDSLAAKRFAQQVERWYKIHQVIFKDTFTKQNPFILYNTHAHFQQTTAISGLIDVGTGGVTEALKNRVVMPHFESNAQTDHVLGHELVHAFQYSLIKDEDSVSFRRALTNLPLWMVEGLAEYMSIGYSDPHTAIWLRSAVMNNKLPSLKDLTEKPNEFFPYRWGQAFWVYVTGIWGDNVIRPLFMETARNGYKDAVKKVLGIDEKKFSEKWKETLVSSFSVYRPSTMDSLINEGLIGPSNGGEVNVVPSLSPDGNLIAFWSEKDLFTFDLYLADAATGKVLRRFTTGRFDSHIDNYNSYESKVAWSPDSRRVAFIGFGKGANQLIITDVKDRKSKEVIAIDGLEAFSNPSWSPDGRSIVVTGMMNGQSDLYIYNLNTGKLKRLTNDFYSELQPSFSSDGKWIVFSTDRQSANLNLLPHQYSHDIALLELATGNITMLNTFKGANNFNPVFGKADEVIYFLSDRDGFRNLYSYNLLNEQISQHTNFFTGITGITQYAPAISVSSRTGKIAFSYYNNDKYTIHVTDRSGLINADVLPNDIQKRAGIIPPRERAGRNIVESNMAAQFIFLPDTSFSTVQYRPKLQLDYLSNTGTGISTGRYGTGLAGGINAMFSDMLGHQELYGTFALNGELSDVAGQFVYYNQKKRLNWGVGYSHIPYYSGDEWVSHDSITINDQKIGVINHSVELVRTYEEQASVLAAYPLSQTRRLEFGGSFSRYHHSRERITQYYHDSTRLPVKFERKRRLPVPEGFNSGNVYLAWIGDNSHFGIASPLKGHRYKFEAGQYFGVVNSQTLMGDYRRYFRFAPFTLATRGLFYGRFGKDANSNVLPPLYLGYPWFIRGYDSESFVGQSQNAPLSINDLAGNKILVTSAELRLPLTGPERLSTIRSKLFFTELNLFTDGGQAWGLKEIVRRGEVNRKSRFVISSGVSLRVNLFGYLVIEPFYAVPWQNGGWQNARFGLNFMPGW